MKEAKEIPENETVFNSVKLKLIDATLNETWVLISNRALEKGKISEQRR